MTLTICTTTRNRPRTFNNLLQRWISRQTVKPSQWLVINDSDPHIQEQYTYTQGQDVIRRKRKEGERHSLCENWLSALSLGRIKGDKVLICEDDDYFDARFIEVMSKMLDEAPVCGLIHDCYWNVRHKLFRNMENLSFSALTCTGFVRDLSGFMRDICKRGNPYIDGIFWDEYFGDKVQLSNVMSNKRAYHVGIKGLDEEPGISTPTHLGQVGARDWGCNKLVEWMGHDDAQVYLDIAARMGE